MQFRAGLDSLTRTIFERARPKQLGAMTVSGPVLAGLAQAYVDAINSGAVPTIQTAWQGVAESECRRAADAAAGVFAEVCTFRNHLHLFDTNPVCLSPLSSLPSPHLVCVSSLPSPVSLPRTIASGHPPPMRTGTLSSCPPVSDAPCSPPQALKLEGTGCDEAVMHAAYSQALGAALAKFSEDAVGDASIKAAHEDKLRSDLKERFETLRRV